jgi:hypothetical protein
MISPHPANLNPGPEPHISLQVADGPPPNPTPRGYLGEQVALVAGGWLSLAKTPSGARGTVVREGVGGRVAHP